MVRPFDIRDISLLYRLALSGSALSYEPYALNGINPLRNALSVLTRRAVPLGSTNPLFVVQHEPDGLGMVELVNSGEQHAAVLMYMAPSPAKAHNQNLWPALIDGLTTLAGQHGARFLVAEADENRREFDLLHQCGFVPLQRQSILRINLPKQGEKAVQSKLAGLRRTSDKDDLHIKLLTARVIPKNLGAFLTMADPTRLMHETKCGFIFMDAAQPAAHISINLGRRSHVMRVLFEADNQRARNQATPLIQAVLADLQSSTPKPVYCVLPAYLGWLTPHLETCGFNAVASRVIMIKSLTAAVRRPLWKKAPLPALGSLIKSKIDQQSKGTMQAANTAPQSYASVCKKITTIFKYS